MIKRLSTIFVILACAAALCGCAAAGYTVFPGTAAFSDDIIFSAKIYGESANAAYGCMAEKIKEIDAEVSLTRENSGLRRFNDAAAGQRVEVGAHCYALFMLASQYYALTDGAFNCAAAPLVELWHLDPDSIAEYRPSLDGTYKSPELPAIEQVSETLGYCDPRLVTATAEGGKYYLQKSDARVKLDFGGIAKGYAVDECVKILEEYDIASALLDISGNAYFYGEYIERGLGSDWHVGVAAPRPRAAETLSRGYVCALSAAANTSAVTSGDYMRYYVHDGADGRVYVPHIVGTDGAPIGVVYDGEWKNSPEYVISATVIGKSSAMCDALSTAVAALGPDKGARLLQKVGYKGLIFTEKRFTIIGDVPLYRPDVYDGYKAFEAYVPDMAEGSAA